MILIIYLFIFINSKLFSFYSNLILDVGSPTPYNYSNKDRNTPPRRNDQMTNQSVKLTEEKQIQINQEGYKAFLKGKSEDDNPYTYGTHSYDLWANGFIEALTENI